MHALRYTLIKTHDLDTHTHAVTLTCISLLSIAWVLWSLTPVLVAWWPRSIKPNTSLVSKNQTDYINMTMVQSWIDCSEIDTMLYPARVLFEPLKWSLSRVVCDKDGYITHSSKVKLKSDNRLVIWLPPAGWLHRGAAEYSLAHPQQVQCCQGGCTGRVCCSSHPWKMERQMDRKNMMDRKVIPHEDCRNRLGCLIMSKAGQKKPSEYVVLFCWAEAQLYKCLSLWLFFHSSYSVTSFSRPRIQTVLYVLYYTQSSKWTF